ncbi:rhodanese-like domain-containing protein [Sulfuriflexus mobilis]|uniref:rhodanese-like domain-containing protein n=1 Tax=Sulfuriflexus mobilis TaxID=1811807 RepID=UPI000F82C384|nr:rhodanese-like domain-containing protein [Sulfuriflexus mobilis]
MKRFVSTLFTAFCGLALMTSVQAAGKVSPTSVDGAKTVNAAESKALFDKGVVFLDVRSDKDWNAGRIPDAIHIELKKQLNEDSMAKEIKKGDEVVIYCNGESCLRSSKAAAKAVGWGYSKVYYFRDGYPAWKAAGYPVE